MKPLRGIVAPANFVLVPAALLPVTCAAGVAVRGAPVAWFPAVLIGVTIGVAAVLSQHQFRAEPLPRRYPMATVRLAIIASMLGITYAVEPWAEPFDVFAAMAMQGAIAAVCGIAALVGTLVLERDFGMIGRVLLAPVYGFLGIVAGYFGSIPLAFLWLEDPFPATHREPFALALAAGFTALALLVHWIATRKR